MATYAVSDLHGCLAFYKAIKGYIQPEDKVYFLGDAGDRGSEPWETIKAIAKDPQFIYIKGNHEEMLVDVMEDALRDSFSTPSIYLLASNGGYETFEQWLQEENKVFWKNYLQNLPHYATYINPEGKLIILSHSGFTPYPSMDLSNIDHLWDRDHIADDWDDNFENTYIVHGHTPTPALKSCDSTLAEKGNKAGALCYCDGHKIDIDNGAVFTGNCTLFNLDTFESVIFQSF